MSIAMDFSKYLHRVLEIDAARRRARVESGCVLDDLRTEARRHGLTFGPDPSTHNHCTLGGMIGNNSCGVRCSRSAASTPRARSPGRRPRASRSCKRPSRCFR
jgi:FAD/FMN-containing dehydrogenase